MRIWTSIACLSGMVSLATAAVVPRVDEIALSSCTTSEESVTVVTITVHPQTATTITVTAGVSSPSSLSSALPFPFPGDSSLGSESTTCTDEDSGSTDVSIITVTPSLSWSFTFSTDTTSSSADAVTAGGPIQTVTVYVPAPTPVTVTVGPPFSPSSASTVTSDTECPVTITYTLSPGPVFPSGFTGTLTLGGSKPSSTPEVSSAFDPFSTFPESSTFGTPSSPILGPVTSSDADSSDVSVDVVTYTIPAQGTSSAQIGTVTVTSGAAQSTVSDSVFTLTLSVFEPSSPTYNIPISSQPGTVTVTVTSAPDDDGNDDDDDWWTVWTNSWESISTITAIDDHSSTVSSQDALSIWTSDEGATVVTVTEIEELTATPSSPGKPWPTGYDSSGASVVVVTYTIPGGSSTYTVTYTIPPLSTPSESTYTPFWSASPSSISSVAAVSSSAPDTIVTVTVWETTDSLLFPTGDTVYGGPSSNLPDDGVLTLTVTVTDDQPVWATDVTTQTGYGHHTTAANASGALPQPYGSNTSSRSSFDPWLTTASGEPYGGLDESTVAVSEVTFTQTVPLGPDSSTVIVVTTEVTVDVTPTSSSSPTPSPSVIITPVVGTFTLSGAYGTTIVLTYTTELTITTALPPESSDLSTGLVDPTSLSPSFSGNFSSPSSSTSCSTSDVLGLETSTFSQENPVPTEVSVWPPPGPSSTSCSTTSSTSVLPLFTSASSSTTSCSNNSTTSSHRLAHHTSHASLGGSSTLGGYVFPSSDGAYGGEWSSDSEFSTVAPLPNSASSTLTPVISSALNSNTILSSPEVTLTDGPTIPTWSFSSVNLPTISFVSSVSAITGSAEASAAPTAPASSLSTPIPVISTVPTLSSSVAPDLTTSHESPEQTSSSISSSAGVSSSVLSHLSSGTELSPSSTISHTTTTSISGSPPPPFVPTSWVNSSAPSTLPTEVSSTLNGTISPPATLTSSVPAELSSEISTTLNGTIPPVPLTISIVSVPTDVSSTLNGTITPTIPLTSNVVSTFTPSVLPTIPPMPLSIHQPKSSVFSLMTISREVSPDYVAKCGAEEDRGSVVLTFDDIPPLSVDKSANGEIGPQPVPFPYHRFFFSPDLRVVSSSSVKYKPISGGQLLQHNHSHHSVAQLGLAWLRSNDCFRFNFRGISLGCDSVDAPCVFTVTALNWDGVDDAVQGATTLEIPACPAATDCELRRQILDPITASTFTNLTAVNITLSSPAQAQAWWADDIQISWADTGCNAAACRAKVPDRTMTNNSPKSFPGKPRRYMRWGSRQLHA